MSDYIIEILEPIINIIEIETSFEDSVSDNISIEYENLSSIEIVNTEKMLASDMPYGYPINDTLGDLPYVRVSGLETYILSLIPSPGSLNIDGGSP